VNSSAKEQHTVNECVAEALSGCTWAAGHLPSISVVVPVNPSFRDHITHSMGEIQQRRITGRVGGIGWLQGGQVSVQGVQPVVDHY
jgi:hypothetical protein